MKISRRDFLLLTAGLAAGCNTVADNTNSTAGRPRAVNAGPAASFTSDGVYNKFRDEGFFLVREGGKLFALSSYCTHRKCKLFVESDHSFYCKCHGSTFDPNGHVTKGPARRDLPVLPAYTNEQGQLIVELS